VKQSKSQLRNYFRRIRSQVPAEVRKDAALSAATYLGAQDFFKQSTHIACYLPLQDEFDTSFIIDVIWEANKQCYLPMVGKDKHTLHFIRYDKEDALQANRFGILEPVDVSREISPSQLDLVIIPLLAFDLHGYRLGTGGGYYDYTFEFLKNAAAKKPFLLGLGYAAQQAEKLYTDNWDITLNGILTEKQVIKF
jgi:5-formyltetrahydrofolate cyclo-ligase